MAPFSRTLTLALLPGAMSGTAKVEVSLRRLSPSEAVMAAEAPVTAVSPLFSKEMSR